MSSRKPKFGKLSGTNANHWVHPWGRDTTRGYSQSDFPAMHNSDVNLPLLKIATCECCGVDFGYTDKPEVFCASHKWLGEHKFLGKVKLEYVRYLDPYNGNAVEAKRIRWTYFIPEEEPSNAIKLQAVIREWLKEEYPDRSEFALPKVLLSVKRVGRNSVLKGLMLSDLQRLANTKHNSVDSKELARVMEKIDRIYCEVM